MPDVTIPAGVARSLGVYHRNRAQTATTTVSQRWHSEMADLLDPRPPSLREQVAEKLRNTSVGHRWDMADDVLAVVADAPIEQILALVGPRLGDWLAAQPLAKQRTDFRAVEQRDADVALLRGEATA